MGGSPWTVSGPCQPVFLWAPALIKLHPWRRESFPLVFLTAFSCLLVQFRGPDLAVAKFAARSPLLSSGYLAEG